MIGKVLKVTQCFKWSKNDNLAHNPFAKKLHVLRQKKKMLSLNQILFNGLSCALQQSWKPLASWMSDSHWSTEDHIFCWQFWLVKGLDVNPNSVGAFRFFEVWVGHWLSRYEYRTMINRVTDEKQRGLLCLPAAVLSVELHILEFGCWGLWLDGWKPSYFDYDDGSISKESFRWCDFCLFPMEQEDQLRVHVGLELPQVSRLIIQVGKVLTKPFSAVCGVTSGWLLSSVRLILLVVF